MTKLVFLVSCIACAFVQTGSAATRNAAILGAAVALQQAQDGDTVLFPAGTYSAPAGTLYLIGKNITVTGPSTGTATLVNIRLYFYSSTIKISNLTFVEKDCYSNEQNLQPCMPALPLIILGSSGHPIQSATLTGLKLNFTRAYTGIAVGYDAAENITMSNIQISDGDMSGITIYQGENIHLSGISVTGSSTTWVDDGIAITSYLGPIRNLTVTLSQAAYTADLVGLGAEMKYPMSSIVIENSTCSHVWYCLLNKTSLGAYAHEADIDGFTVSNLRSK